MFWLALMCAAIVLMCAMVAKKKLGASKTLMIVAAIDPDEVDRNVRTPSRRILM